MLGLVFLFVIVWMLAWTYGMNLVVTCRHQQDLTQAKQKEQVDIVHDSAVALLAVINDILDLSKIEAGQFEIACVIFNPVEEVERSIAILRAQAEAKGIDLECDIDADLPQYVRGDPGCLRQVLINLTGNAVKFTEQGRVSVDVRRIGLGNRKAAISFAIRDTGPGIPPGSIHHLFERFVQGDASHTRENKGRAWG